MVLAPAEAQASTLVMQLNSLAHGALAPPFPPLTSPRTPTASTQHLHCAAHLVHPADPDVARLLVALRLGQEGDQMALEALLVAPV